jgi:hypothetical protein
MKQQKVSFKYKLKKQLKKGKYKIYAYEFRDGEFFKKRLKYKDLPYSEAQNKLFILNK